MSSSGSRGPPMSRYNDAKRKPFYNRRSNSSGSGYNGNALDPALANKSVNSTQSVSNPATTSNVPLNNRRYQGSTGNLYSSYNSYGSSKYNTYYPSYGSYNSFKRDQSNASNINPLGAFRSSVNSRSSLSNSAPKRRNNSILNSKRPDTYYPSKPYFSKSQVDHYSTKKKYPYNSQYNSGYYDSKYDSNYDSSYYNRRPSSLLNSGNSHHDDSYKYNGQYSKSNGDKYDPEKRYDDDDTENKRSDDDKEMEDVSHDHSMEEDDDEENELMNEENRYEDEKPNLDFGGEDDGEVPEAGEHEDHNPSNEIYREESPSDPMEIVTPLPLKNLEPGKDLGIQQDDQLDASNNAIEEGTLPLNKLDSLFCDLKKEFASANVKPKYSKVSENLRDYPCYSRNIQLYRVQKAKLLEYLSETQKKYHNHKLHLWKEYKSYNTVYDSQRKNMEEQLKVIHPPNDDFIKELESADIRVKSATTLSDVTSTVSTAPPTTSTPDVDHSGGFGSRRASRRHGDLVTTEAEFEEVLRNLSKQDDEDPMLRALKVSAPVPDMILNPDDEILLSYLDSNNIVTDKASWASRVRTQFFDTFSNEEHESFTEGFIKYPKKFGYISKFMGGLRTTEECVIHYYLTKKGVNYKNLIAQYKKKMTKKNPGKKKKSRNSSLNFPSVETPTEESVVSSDKSGNEPAVVVVPVPVPVPVLPVTDDKGALTETGTKKRTASVSNEDATVTKKPHIEQAPPTSPTQTQVIEVKKKPRKKKEENVQNDVKDKEVAKEEHPDGKTEDKDKSRKNMLSYWSITEANEFPELLKEYGTRWTTIADKLSTKTATMVRNYFQRNAEKSNWSELADEANKRLNDKFAAVVGASNGTVQENPEAQVITKPEVSEVSQVSRPPQFAPHFPSSVVYGTSLPQPPNLQAMALGHASYAPYSGSALPYQPSFQHQPIAPVLKPTIGSIITSNDTPLIEVKREVHKSSIMSLLNNDSPGRSPKTPDNTSSNEVPKSEPPKQSNNISALLNPQSSSSSNESPTTMPRLSAILANPNNDK